MDEYSGIDHAKVPREALSVIQEIHAASKHDQFLMMLRQEFEITRAALLNRDPLPSLDVCLG